ncbi:MAG: hypothetical protein PVJ95_05645 [Cellvibrionales bacterium]|jgi:hypothetical protein
MLKLLLIVFLFVSPALVRAECTPEAFELQLAQSGLAYQQHTDHTWQISNGADTLVATVDREDGAVLWTGILERQSRASVAWVNKVHLQMKYVQLAIDSDFDLMAYFALPNWDGGCLSHAAVNSGYFLRILGHLKADLAANRESEAAAQQVIQANGLRRVGLDFEL